MTRRRLLNLGAAAIASVPGSWAKSRSASGSRPFSFAIVARVRFAAHVRAEGAPIHRRAFPTLSAYP